MSSWRISDRAVEQQAKPCLCAGVYRTFLGWGMRQGWGEEGNGFSVLPLLDSYWAFYQVATSREKGGRRKKERATSPASYQLCAFESLITRQRNRKYWKPACSSVILCGMQNPWKLLPGSFSQMFTVPAQTVINKFRLTKPFVLSHYNSKTEYSLSYVIQHSLLSLFMAITCN